MDDSIFKHEQKVLEQARNVAKNAPHGQVDVETFEDLAKDYGKLFRQMKQMVKIVDRQHAELQRVTGILHDTNRELEFRNDLMLVDLKLAAEVQKSIFPVLVPPPYLQTEMRFFPHSEVSGDMYYSKLRGNFCFDLFLGDATGHGVAAAFLTIMADIALEEKAGETKLNLILEHLNNVLAMHTPLEMFLTGTYVRITADGLLTYISAGHPPPFIMSPTSGEITRLDANNLPLGMFFTDSAGYNNFKHQLQPGDVLLLYTDGIAEQRSPQGELFGYRRLEEFVHSYQTYEIAGLLDELVMLVKNFSKKDSWDDDVTVIGVKYVGI